MKTTIYELLGMIKDNKAPKKIKYTDEDGDTYIYELEKDNSYWCKEIGNWLFSCYEIQTILNDEVEILDEPKEDKIEKIDMFDYFTVYSLDDISIGLLKHLENNFSVLNEKINEIIDILNKKKI